MIKKAVIHNYRSCLETEVELHPELTVLIGANGVGKTNILRALELLSKIDNTRRINPQIPYEQEGYNYAAITLFLDKSGEKYYELKASIIFSESDSGKSNIKLSEVSYKDVNTSSKYDFLDFDVSTYSYLIDNIDDLEIVPLSERSKFKNETPIISSFRSISYYSASQFIDSSRCPLSVDFSPFGFKNKSWHTGKNHSTYIVDLYLCSLNNSRLFRQYTHLIGEDGLKLVEDIHLNVQTIPSKGISLKEAIRQENSREGANRKIVTPTFKVDGSYLSPNQLSDGTFKMLALIFYIISDENNMLLIEEPEISIHHGLLDSLIELIKQESKHKQIIVSTHSELVLDAVQPENVLVVTKEHDKGTLAKPLTDNLSKDDYKALKKYLETEGNLGEYWREMGLEYG